MENDQLLKEEFINACALICLADGNLNEAEIKCIEECDVLPKELISSIFDPRIAHLKSVGEGEIENEMDLCVVRLLQLSRSSSIPTDLPPKFRSI